MGCAKSKSTSAHEPAPVEVSHSKVPMDLIDLAANKSGSPDTSSFSKPRVFQPAAQGAQVGLSRLRPSAGVRQSDRAGCNPAGIDLSEEQAGLLAMIRANLPRDVSIHTPFGARRVCYCDYTASGRPLAYIEEYLRTVVGPMFANTHTETSATGLQTTHFREEARSIILDGLGANRKEHALIFVGSGCTGAINKFLQLMGMHVPFHLRACVHEHAAALPSPRPLVLISHAEHHSNELMWRESLCDVITVPHADNGDLDVKHLQAALETERQRQSETGETRLVLGSFSAGSNVTGLRTSTYAISALLHKYGALAAWDFAAAAPYVSVSMSGDPSIADSHLDAVFISPHKLVGGPGTPGILLARRHIFPHAPAQPPTIPGGGTVLMVWPNGGVVYEEDVCVREEAGTPDIMGSIRCGLAFQLRARVTPALIEKIEGEYARRAVERLKALPNLWLMGDHHDNIKSAEMRLSITSFNVLFPPAALESAPPEVAAALKGKMLHPHFVAALLNDLYGIQARSGCSCAGPLAIELFEPLIPGGYLEALISNAEKGFHAYKPGWARVNFNYFITEHEWHFVCSAIEQIAMHGWRLLPLYALCLRTGQYIHNSNFDKFDTVHTLSQINLSGRQVTWPEPVESHKPYEQTLSEALAIFAEAPARVRRMLYRFRDLRRADTVFPHALNPYRYFVLGSEVLPLLSITQEQVKRERSTDQSLNPTILAEPKHHTANPWFTYGRPQG